MLSIFFVDTIELTTAKEIYLNLTLLWTINVMAYAYRFSNCLLQFSCIALNIICACVDDDNIVIVAATQYDLAVTSHITSE